MLRASGGEHPRRSGIVLALLSATGDWRCGYCQVGWWWLSASPSGAGSHSRPTPRTPQPLSKPHRLTQQCTKLSTPTGAPSTASSGATIAIALGRGVGEAFSPGYPIAEIALTAPVIQWSFSNRRRRGLQKTPCVLHKPQRRKISLARASGHLKIHGAHRPHFSTYLVAPCSKAMLISAKIADMPAVTQRDSLVRFAISPLPP